jgi:TonB family protein
LAGAFAQVYHRRHLPGGIPVKSHIAVLLLLATPAVADGLPPNSYGGLSKAACEYPAAALAAHAEGNTTLSYVGTSAGELSNIKVVHSAGRADLDQAAAACVSRWHFDARTPVGKLSLGPHKFEIGWTIPQQPDAKAEGKYMGLPHNCDEFYPQAAAIIHAAGTTRVRFKITEQGGVRDPGIVVSSGNADLDAAALVCVTHWRYIPAIKDDKPVEVPWHAIIVWKFKEPELPPEVTE